MDPILGKDEIEQYTKNQIIIHYHLERFTVSIEDVDLVADVKITRIITEKRLESQYHADLKYYDNF